MVRQIYITGPNHEYLVLMKSPRVGATVRNDCKLSYQATYVTLYVGVSSKFSLALIFAAQLEELYSISSSQLQMV